jgi:hypothetical protein
LLKKEIMPMWKNQCPDIFESTAPSPWEREKEGEAGGALKKYINGQLLTTN